MAAVNKIDYVEQGRDLMAALQAVEQVIAGQGIEPALHHLVLLRASQINKCAFCVDMHIRDARKAGEINQRLDRLIVWRQVGDFTPREKAAFAWTEALTELKDGADLAPLREDLRAHFGEGEVVALTVMISMINLWNRINIAAH